MRYLLVAAVGFHQYTLGCTRSVTGEHKSGTQQETVYVTLMNTALCDDRQPN